MGWYDVFSRFYDSSLEDLYREHRVLARQRLELEPGHHVLDAGCGTGLSLDELVPAVGARGGVLGVDRSKGMLARAQKRVERNEWSNVSLLRSPLQALDGNVIAEHYPAAEAGFDRLLCFLVLSALEDWQEVFASLWQLLRPGGKAVIIDTHDPKPSFQGRMVNLVARADIRRPVWQALEERAEDFGYELLDCDKRIGGRLLVASGRRPEGR